MTTNTVDLLVERIKSLVMADYARQYPKSVYSSIAAQATITGKAKKAALNTAIGVLKRPQSHAAQMVIEQTALDGWTLHSFTPVSWQEYESARSLLGQEYSTAEIAVFQEAGWHIAEMQNGNFREWKKWRAPAWDSR